MATAPLSSDDDKGFTTAGTYAEVHLPPSSPAVKSKTTTRQQRSATTAARGSKGRRDGSETWPAREFDQRGVLLRSSSTTQVSSQATAFSTVSCEPWNTQAKSCNTLTPLLYNICRSSSMS